MIFAYVITAIVGFLVLFPLIRWAPKWQLMAVPGEHRQHATATPLVGGIAIFIALSVGLLMLDGQQLVIYPCLLVMLLIGVLDDRYHLPSWTRFLAQGLIAYWMVVMSGVQLVNLGELIGEKDTMLGDWSLAFTIFATIGVINAVNMSDGMDGLLAMILLIIFAALLLAGTQHQVIVMLSICALLGFSMLNLRIFKQRASVFLGDAGSMMIGALLAWLLIAETQSSQAAFAPVTALWLLALPLYDAVAMLLIRPLFGQSPFTADRSHYHHLILRKGFSVNQTLAIIFLLQTAIVGLGLLLHKQQVPEATQITLFLSGFALYMLILAIAKKGQ